MLQFVLGDVLKNHQQWCIDDIVKTLQTVESSNDPIYYLVPDHIKFDSEIDILKGLRDKMTTEQSLYARLNVNIYSFSRLAWYLLKDTGLLTKQAISPFGLTMLVRYILTEHDDQLTYYKYDSKKQGFIERLCDLFLELRQSNINAHHFDVFLTQTHDANAYIQNRQEKIKELLFLYDAFNVQLIGHYLEKDYIMTLLTNYIETHDFSRSTFYLHGFERLNALELQFVQTLIVRAKKVVMTLPLHQKYSAQQFDPIRHVPFETYTKLSAFCKKEGIKQQQDVFVSTGYERYSQPMQQFVTKWADIFQKGGLPTEKVDVSETVFIHSTPTKHDEVELVARKIRQLIATRNYRFSDFYVLTRQVETYETLIKAVFSESHIPYFLDNAAEMAQHPLLELISTLQDIQQYNWQYKDVMRLLRCGLIPFADETAIDHLDNELLANGYFGKWWFDADKWENESVRQQIIAIINPFFQQLNDAKTMRDAATMLYRFFESSGVIDTLTQWRNDDNANGRLQQASQQEQVFKTFTHLLDEFVTILGSQPYDAQTFYTILKTGLQQSEFNIVPPSLDQVTVASSDGKRVSPKKITFIIGATDTKFPKWYDNHSLLNNDERTLLSQSLQQTTSFLPLSASDRTRVEPFVAWQLFASATEQLYIFYPQSESTESSYITLLKKWFHVGYVSVEQLYGVGKSYVRKVVQQLATAYFKQQSFDAYAKIAYDTLQQTEHLQSHYHFLKTSLAFKNVPKTLHSDIVKQLYRGNFHLSITQLENYFKDPYSHFLKYGLKLKERPLFTLDAAKIGNVFHHVLDNVYKTVLKQNMQLRQLSDSAFEQLLHETIERTFLQPENKLFQRTKAMQFIKSQLVDTLLFTGKQLYQQSQLVHLNTSQTEWRFGGNKDDNATVIPSIPLNDNQAIYLRGIIDRVDVNDTHYAVIDYKTSDRKFDLLKFSYGISLQLMTYLYAMQQTFTTNNNQAKQPLGAFYRTIGFNYETVPPKQVEQPLQREFIRLNGIKTAPANVFQTLDEHAQLFQMRLTKEGKFAATETNVFNEVQLEQLVNYLQFKIKEAGIRLLSGDIRLAPVKDELFIPSLNEYSAIARFDPTLRENRYVILNKQEDPFQRIQNILGGTYD